MLRVRVVSDDITLTVDGKDTYDEVKKSGRYRWEDLTDSQAGLLCVLDPLTWCVFLLF